MGGILVQVNVSNGGVPKRAVPSARISPEGVEGDRQADRRYHGGPRQAVCLFDARVLDAMAAEAYPVAPGSLGENLTTRGIDYRSIRIGDTYQIGDAARVEITKPRVPCKTITVYGDSIIKRLWGPAVPWGESGFYARVTRSGTVRPGDVVAHLLPGAEAPPSFTRKVALRT